MNYLIGIVAITGVMIIWVLVQILWKKAFSDEEGDTDALAIRGTCGSCNCTTKCNTRNKKLI